MQTNRLNVYAMKEIELPSGMATKIAISKTYKETICNVVWKACDSFRGTLDGSEYKDYALTMLFVKYLSDFYKEKIEELKEKYGDNEERIKSKLSKEKFKLDDKCTFDYLLQNKEAPNLGEIMNMALERIEEDNRDKLDGIFRSIDFNNKNKLGDIKERNSLLKHLLEDFADPRLDLRPSRLDNQDIIGDAYEYLIANFASDAGKKGGEFYTPSEVSIVVAKLLNPKDGSTIYDPTCGSGSLLIKAAKEVGTKNFRLYGQERNGQTHALCKMNMFLHEINDSVIEWGDTIRNPLHLLDSHTLKKFDYISANPPFSLDKWGEDIVFGDLYKRFTFGTPPKSKGDYAFVLHMLNSLNDGGTMAVVLPHGVLFRGASEGKIRQRIIEENLLDAVIGLPANLFFGTSIPACIMVLKKGRTNKDILFIDASSDGNFEKGKNQNKLRPEDINKIVDTYHSRKELDKYSHVATLSEIQENNYNLNIPRYVDTFEEEVSVDIEATKTNISNIEKELADLKSKMASYLKELGV